MVSTRTADTVTKPVSGRRVVPRVLPDGKVAFALTAPSAHLSYHGGHLLETVQVVTVFWGSAWQQAAQSALIPRINQFFDFILGSALMDVLAEYGVAGHPIGHGHRIASVTVTNPQPGGGTGTISDAQIQQMLQQWVSGHVVPQPTGNTLYFVYLPPGVVSTLDGESSCVNFCGYHNHVGGTLFYAVEPFITCAGCVFGHGIFDSLTKVSSHELCEAITDPALDAWFDDNNGGNEIGDICNAGTTSLGGFVIQTEWSNRANACVSIPRGDHFFTVSLAERDNAVLHLGYGSEGIACFVSATPAAGLAPLHRLFQPATGEHFYTTSTSERDNAIQHLGFQSEGESCFVSTGPAAGLSPLHRLLQPTTSEHFYTTSDAERNNAVANLGYQNEGEAGYVHVSDPSGVVPLYRLRNPTHNVHFFTTSLPERDNAIQKLGYQSEAVACYVDPNQTAGTIPLFRMFNAANADHFYTTNAAERDNAVQHLGYASEGVACFVNGTQVAGTTALHRLLHAATGEHFYTTSAAERDNAVQHLGYQSEGDACFVHNTDPSGQSPLYRVYRTV